MTEDDGKKTLGLRGSRPGNVKQSFSHGRTKNVVVETKRKRVVVPKPGAPKPTATGGAAPVMGDPSKRPAGISDAELERRMKALAMAKAREEEKAAAQKELERLGKKLQKAEKAREQAEAAKVARQERQQEIRRQAAQERQNEKDREGSER